MPEPKEAEEDPAAVSMEKEDPIEREKCLVRIQNYRDPVNVDVSGDAGLVNTSNSLIKDAHASRTSAVNVADAEANSKMDTLSETSSQRNQKQIETFEFEKLSSKVILMKQSNEAFEGNCMVQHCEAVFAVRKAILEKAKLFWAKEAKDLNTNYVLGMTSMKQRQLDNRFEEHCIQKLGYQMGEQHEDQNIRVTFKTFLRADDPRLEE